MKTLTTFPRLNEFEKMKAVLNSHNLIHEVIDPYPAFSRVGCPAVILTQESRQALSASGGGDLITSGWIDYHVAKNKVPSVPSKDFSEDIFGTGSIMVLAPCVADMTKIRLIAHLSGNIAPVFPYLNTEMRNASYNKDDEIFTFMDSYRMVTLYPQRISIAKADEIVDGWCVLEKLRCFVNEVYSRRGSIEPSYELRKKPPAIEIYKRLPATNCGVCGQKTCMAFALSIWSGNAEPSECSPIIEGDFQHMKEAFLEICAGQA